MSIQPIDSAGRWVLVDEEKCVHCGRSSRGKHPGGVVPGRWKCLCGRYQNEADAQRTESSAETGL